MVAEIEFAMAEVVIVRKFKYDWSARLRDKANARVERWKKV